MIWPELVQRGLVKQCTDHAWVRSSLENDQVTFYLGIDPTADSMHVGHLLPLITAKRLMDAGHRAIILIGDGTARIGDPSGKSATRPMMDEETIDNNAMAIRDQVKKLIGIETGQVVFNGDWLCTMNFMEMMREVGAHFSVNNMLRADCFKSRMEQEQGLSFLEFSYMVMQGFDFFELNRRFGCALQIGGDDQWSNMLAGCDLIHKKTDNIVNVLTLPLLVNSDGTKMGKTEKGTVWLDEKKTSVFDFFQFWRNIPDDKVKECIDWFTVVEPRTFEKQFDNINEAKKFLATQITSFVHGWEAAQQALEQAEALFEKHDASKSKFIKIAEGAHVLDIIIKSGFAKSRTEARNLMLNRGITINEVVQTNPTILISRAVFGNEPVLRKGKKHFCRLLIEDKCPDQNT